MSENTKQRLLIGVIVVSFLPLFLAVQLPNTLTTGGMVQYTSSVLGYIGITLLIWQLILGTRAISGLFFEDLAAKLKIHRLLGKYGVLLIFIHPILILFRYSHNITYLFTPSLSEGYERYVTFGRIAFWSLLVIWLTSAIIRSKIAYRPWKYLHYLAYPTLLFSLLHVPEIGSSFEQQLIQFYWYVFIVIALLCTILRARYFVGFGKVSYELVSTIQIADNTYLYRFHPLGKVLDIKFGQYVYIQPGLLHEEHPFTVLDSDQRTGDVLIGIKTFGKFTEKLQKLRAGDTVNIDGPYGVFAREIIENPSIPRVYIAGGIGITPFVKHALSNTTAKQYMFYANATHSSGAFQKELRNKLGSHYIEIFSNETGTDTKNTKYGFLSKTTLAEHISSPLDYEYFICGPKPMITSSVEILNSMGVPKKQIHTEAFGF